MIRREITFELPPWLIMPLRSDFNIRIFWISSARRIEPEYDFDPAVPICFPRCVNAFTAYVRVRAWTDWLGECYEYLPKWAIPDLPEGNLRSSRTDILMWRASFKDPCRLRFQNEPVGSAISASRNLFLIIKKSLRVIFDIAACGSSLRHDLPDYDGRVGGTA
jgi:hypothetical protein